MLGTIPPSKTRRQTNPSSVVLRDERRTIAANGCAGSPLAPDIVWIALLISKRRTVRHRRFRKRLEAKPSQTGTLVRQYAADMGHGREFAGRQANVRKGSSIIGTKRLVFTTRRALIR